MRILWEEGGEEGEEFDHGDTDGRPDRKGKDPDLEPHGLRNRQRRDPWGRSAKTILSISHADDALPFLKP